MKAYSQDLRDRVIDLYERYKYTKSAIARLFKINRHTIANWIERYKETGDYSSKQHCQTGRKIRFNDQEKVLMYLAEHPDAEGIEIRNSVAPNLPMSTFYDALSRMKITYKKRAKI
jgi:isftu1 transposase